MPISQHSRALCANEGAHGHVDVGGAPLAAVEAALVGRLALLEISARGKRGLITRCSIKRHELSTTTTSYLISLTLLSLSAAAAAAAPELAPPLERRLFMIGEDEDENRGASHGGGVTSASVRLLHCCLFLMGGG